MRQDFPKMTKVFNEEQKLHKVGKRQKLLSLFGKDKII
jgi:hypothetical protein